VPAARAASGWASLTPAEREVVTLVVAGLTNPEIGARLFMSRATVKTHLAHVFAKLGVANRTELATLAAGRSGRADGAAGPRSSHGLGPYRPPG
jgi:DNA-binding CsgD family transcriptional regulator